MEVRETKFLLPLCWGILPKALWAKVITLGFCNVLKSRMSHYKIIHEFVHFCVGLLKCIVPRAMSEECLETFYKSANQFLALLVSSGYALLAGCSRSSQAVYQLPMHFQVQIKMEFSATRPNNTSFLHSSLYLCRTDQLVFFICYYLVKGLYSFTAFQPTVCSSSNLLTFELRSRAVFQD